MEAFSAYGEFQHSSAYCTTVKNQTNTCAKLSLNQLKWLWCCQTIEYLFNISYFSVEKNIIVLLCIYVF